MIHTNNPIIKHKAGLLNLAEELGNVSKACKIMGVSRDTFYRYQELLEDGNIDQLINKSRRAPNIKNRVDGSTEQAVLSHAIEQPAHGQHRTSNVRPESLSPIAGFARFGFTMIWKTIKTPKGPGSQSGQRWHCPQ